MFTKAMLTGAAVLVVGISPLAAQTVDRETVSALRQMAIEAGEASSSADMPAAKSPRAIEAEQRSISRHRVDFFARVYAGKQYAEDRRKGNPARIISTQPSTPAQARQPIDRETVQALRQLAIRAGQTSSSADRPPAKSPQAIEAARRSIARHRVDFFARAYAGKKSAEDDRGHRTVRALATLLSIPTQEPQPVDHVIVQALRQIAIEAGQTSNSADRPPAKSAKAIEAERKSIERHRADFFARVYGGKPGV